MVPPWAATIAWVMAKPSPARQSAQLTLQTPARPFPKGEPVEVVIGSLQPDTRYYYQFRAANIPHVAGTFHTQRAAGSPFIFTITADSHLDDRVIVELYQRTLADALSDAPDFHIDLGDTFMTEKAGLFEWGGLTGAVRQHRVVFHDAKNPS
jgi:phosphodiesterase/alkaline phosphatase D-like protein